MRAPMTVAPADGCGACGPKSGAHRRALQLGAQPFELAAADVFEVRCDGAPPPLLRRGRRGARSAARSLPRPCARAPRSRPGSRPRWARRARRPRRPGADARPYAGAGRCAARALSKRRQQRDRGRLVSSPTSVSTLRLWDPCPIARRARARPASRFGAATSLDHLGPAAFADVGDTFDECHPSVLPRRG